MAASFIKKSNGSFYLRLTGDTESVMFSAVSQAGYGYTFSVDGVVRVSKPYNDNEVLYYTQNANPIPAGGNLDNGRFPGTEIEVSYPGSGIRDYILSFSAFPGSGTQFYLGGAPLTWGGYAYPGDGYIENSLAVGIKTGGVWKNAGNIFIKHNGSWREVTNAYVKHNGSWRKFYQNFGNSSWINMLENIDDAIDFGVYVIALWTWPVLNWDGFSTYYPDSASSTANSSIVVAPVTQSVTLYIELDNYLGDQGSSASILLRRIDDGAIIWSHSITDNSANYTETFTINAGYSYRFESTAFVPAGVVNTVQATVRRQNSSGTIVYRNSAVTFLD